MFRMVAVILAVGAVALLVPATPAAPPGGLKLGEEFKGKCGGEQQALSVGGAGAEGAKKFPKAQAAAWIKWAGRAHGFTMFGYAGEVPVTLKEGQGLDVTVTVVGEKRRVFVKLLDPSGKQIASSEDVEVKTARLAVEEVPASGSYKIVVVSDQIGGFTLKSKGASGDEADEDKLKEKIKQREDELAELKAKLKALQAKRSGLRTKDPE